MYCLKCGTKIGPGEKFCPTCGAKLEDTAPGQDPGSKSPSGGRFDQSVYDDLSAQLLRQRQQGGRDTAPQPQAKQPQGTAPRPQTGTPQGVPPQSQPRPDQQRSAQKDIQRYTSGYSTGGSGKKSQRTSIIVLLVVAILLAVLALVVFTRGSRAKDAPSPAASASQSAVTSAETSLQPEEEDEAPDASAGSSAGSEIPSDAEIAGQQPAGAEEEPAAQEQPANETESPIEDTDYILPGVDTGYIDRAVLEAMTDEELRLARNEIYARHGRMFDSADLDEYFRSTSWYTPTYTPAEFDALGDSVLNRYEIANRDLIVEIEASRKS